MYGFVPVNVLIPVIVRVATGVVVVGGDIRCAFRHRRVCVGIAISVVGNCVTVAGRVRCVCIATGAVYRLINGGIIRVSVIRRRCRIHC